MPMEDSFKNDMFDNIDYEKLLDGNNNKSVIGDSLRDAGLYGEEVREGQQMEALQSAIDNYAKYMNESAIAKSTGLPKATLSAQYKGFAAEEFFKNRMKINALAEGVPDYKLGIYTEGILPDGSELSPIDTQVDISIWTRKHFWSRPVKSAEYQSKMFDNANKYAKVINNPKYKDVSFVGGSGQGVNDKVMVDVDGRRISSDAITPEEARNLADRMKAQDTPQYEFRREKINQLNAKSFGDSVKTGAVIGCVLSTVREIIDIIKNKKELTEEQFVESIKNILCGTAEGAVRAGTINLSVQLLGKMLGKEITSASLEAVPAVALTNFSVDLAKDLYRCFVVKSIDTDDLLCNSADNLFTSAVGFGGGWIGGQAAGLLLSFKVSAETGAAIGSSFGPIGTIIGSVIGGVLFGIGARVICNIADKDAYAAFEDCVKDINSHLELSGVEKIYYFADSMSSLSAHKLSFKDLLPCYNLISDLKEYKYHKKALKNLKIQLQSNLDELDEKKKQALIELEIEHKRQLNLLTSSFEEQRKLLRDEYRDSMNTYVVTSYMQFVSIYEVQSESIDELLMEYEIEGEAHSAVLQYMKNRNKANSDLNLVLSELMSDVESKQLLGPFLEKLMWFMQQDEFFVDKQYVSFEQVIYLVDSGVLL